MNVIIPAAGLGTRLRPHTLHRPKPLVPVAGNTVLGHVLDKLAALEVDDLVFIVGYLGDQLADYVNENYDFRAHFVEQQELLGQAHAIALAREWLRGPTLVLFVDTIFEADLDALADVRRDGVIYAREVENPSRFGIIEPRDDGTIARLVEKPDEPPSNLAVIGLYYVRDGAWLERAIDDLIAHGEKTKGEYYIADALQRMIDDGAELEARSVSFWADCGTFPAVLETNRHMLEALDDPAVEGTIDDQSTLVPPVRVAPGAVIERSVVGPYVHIGPGARITDSRVGPHVSLAAGVQVTDSHVQDAIVDRETTIDEATVAESLIGARATVYGAPGPISIGDHSLVGRVTVTR